MYRNIMRSSSPRKSCDDQPLGGRMFRNIMKGSRQRNSCDDQPSRGLTSGNTMESSSQRDSRNDQPASLILWSKSSKGRNKAFAGYSTNSSPIILSIPSSRDGGCKIRFTLPIRRLGNSS